MQFSTLALSALMGLASGKQQRLASVLLKMLAR